MNLKLVNLIFLLLFSFCFSQKQSKSSAYHVDCMEEEKSSDNELDPVLIKICEFRNFQSVKTGTADYKGRYSYEYDLYCIVDGGKQRIKNSELFGSGADWVEKRINQDLKAQYQKDLNNPHLKACMEWIDFRYYELDEMGMSFTENNQIEFYIDHNIGGACYNVAHAILQYQLSEFAEYLN